VDGDPLGIFGGVGQPLNAVGDVDRLALLVDVAEAGEEVGVSPAGAGEQLRGDSQAR
jgi:hypothetical protein